MKTGWRCRACIAALLACATAACAQEKISAERADGAQVPLLVYEPARENHACPPLVLLSPGAGGDERGLRYLGEALSGKGWRVIAIGHRESGAAALKRDITQMRGIRAGLEKMVADPALYRARFMDIDAAKRWAQSRCRAPFTALIGHSMGARTVQLEAGARNRVGLKPDGGFDAYVALSPSGADSLFAPDSGATINAPILMITGTRDDGLGGDYRWRMRAFDALSSGHCDRLAVIDGATHMNLAGALFASKTEAAVVPLIENWLAGVRTGRCIPPPRMDGVKIITQNAAADQPPR
ncbi:MAG TPA: alpha/beta hydrolase [Rhodanobacteraceae bacterium]